ncbi:MAG: amino acid ABC transporter ATP-binding protein [Burkholderiales bacterium]|nr:amino acid ABC transporter ATP-binding protein [Burkholderiales bacterium]
MRPRPAGTRVRFEQVGKSYGRVPVLQGIDLEVPGGSTTCIVGPSGSGKSTLLRCANLMERPERGHIWLGESDITAPGVDVDAVRQRVGMVFQHSHLYPHLGVLDNVSLALRQVRRMAREPAEALAREQLRAVGLEGLEGRRPADLSGGQQQRVAIARALAMAPEVMLFDEATSALDPELVKGVLAVMRELARRGMTMLVVTHEMHFAREVAGQVVFVDAGRVLEVAPPDEFFSRPKHPRLRHFLDQVL